MSNKISQKQGFTIIEVVLVLAIAGLIFLMVFVAFPALQRNQRDTQRRQDYANLGAAVITAASSNNGNFPSSVNATAINASGQDPDRNPYNVYFRTVGAASPSYTGESASGHGDVFVYTGVGCTAASGEGATGYAAKTAKDFIVVGYLESGDLYCKEFSL